MLKHRNLLENSPYVQISNQSKKKSGLLTHRFYSYNSKMYRPKDSDIFGTSNCFNHPRIENPSFIDPNEVFKKRVDQRYQDYSGRLGPVQQTITKKPIDASQVNERVEFDEYYHRARKEKDLQSNIFYPARQCPKRQMENNRENSENNSLAANRPVQQINFGRKETMKREILGLPFNNCQFKGNTSRLFDMNQRISDNRSNQPLIPLVPHGMQWDQHDSVRYAHINYQQREHQRQKALDCVKQHQVQIKQQVEASKYIADSSKLIDQKSNQLQQKPTKNVNQIEVRVLKGWSQKFMEGLAKHCKLNKSAIISFTAQGQKATIRLKRSERWQNVTDWLQKDCKLKLRVIK